MCSGARRSIRSAALILFALSLGGSARADAPSIGILPFVSEVPAHEIYETPVASALVRALTGKVPGAVTLVRLDRPPRDLERVVDGTITRRGQNISLTARVRDMRQGIVIATASTGERPLTEIDKLPPELASKMIEALSRPTLEEPEPLPPSASPSASASGPPLLIYPTSGPRLTGHQPRAERFAAQFGYRAVVPGHRGTPAKIALYMRFEDFSFQSAGSVFTGRGAIHLSLVDSTGRAVYARRVATDTVVGKRGDGPQALVGMMTEQALDIVFPEVRRLSILRPGTPK